MSIPAWDTNRSPRRSPFKTPPLRWPGQSLDERIGELQAQIDDLLVTPLCIVVVTVYVWVQYWMARPLNPFILTTVAIVTGERLRLFKQRSRICG